MNLVIRNVGDLLAFGNGCVIRPTTTLQPIGFVWFTLSHHVFPKAMDKQPEKYIIHLTGSLTWQVMGHL